MDRLGGVLLDWTSTCKADTRNLGRKAWAAAVVPTRPVGHSAGQPDKRGRTRIRVWRAFAGPRDFGRGFRRGSRRTKSLAEQREDENSNNRLLPSRTKLPCP